MTLPKINAYASDFARPYVEGGKMHLLVIGDSIAYQNAFGIQKALQPPKWTGYLGGLSWSAEYNNWGSKFYNYSQTGNTIRLFGGASTGSGTNRIMENGVLRWTTDGESEKNDNNRQNIYPRIETWESGTNNATFDETFMKKTNRSGDFFDGKSVYIKTLIRRNENGIDNVFKFYDANYLADTVNSATPTNGITCIGNGEIDVYVHELTGDIAGWGAPRSYAYESGKWFDMVGGFACYTGENDGFRYGNIAVGGTTMGHWAKTTGKSFIYNVGVVNIPGTNSIYGFTMGGITASCEGQSTESLTYTALAADINTKFPHFNASNQGGQMQVTEKSPISGVSPEITLSHSISNTNIVRFASSVDGIEPGVYSDVNLAALITNFDITHVLVNAGANGSTYEDCVALVERLRGFRSDIKIAFFPSYETVSGKFKAADSVAYLCAAHQKQAADDTETAWFNFYEAWGAPELNWNDDGGSGIWSSYGMTAADNIHPSDDGRVRSGEIIHGLLTAAGSAPLANELRAGHTVLGVTGVVDLPTPENVKYNVYYDNNTQVGLYGKPQIPSTTPRADYIMCDVGGTTTPVQWKYVNGGWVSAITVCRDLPKRL